MASRPSSRPERALVATFAALCALSTALLAIPAMTAAPGRPALLDLAFTAVSAVCVTGLTTIDTAHFSLLGQVVILLSIQLGGLGVITFSAVGASLFGHRMSLGEEGILASIVGARSRVGLMATVRSLVLTVLVTEAAGALLLLACFAFADGAEPWSAKAWRAVFTAISAYCNAGFALSPDSLGPYQGNPNVLCVVSTLVILGGFSPLLLLAPKFRAQSRARPYSLQALLAMTTSAGLLLAGFAFVLVVEWDGVLGEMSAVDKLSNAWFYSASLRTAGFSSFDLSQLRTSTWFLSIVWMIIGGSPGGTAGGIRTTTVAVLVFLVARTLTGRDRAVVFRRTIGDASTHKAVVVAIVACAGLSLAILALLLFEDQPATALIFEAASALGTVGLSVGATAHLSTAGKWIVMACMFIGRVGGLSLLYLLAGPTSVPRRQFPVEEVSTS